MNVRLYCPVCETSGRVVLPGPETWRCPGCDHVVPLEGQGSEASLPCCAVCGNGELYRKKDFPHSFGMGILVAACLTSTITYWLYEKWLTWAILIGSAIIDGVLYLVVGDVIVCYRCHAEHRGVPACGAYPPFELTIHERYRQEQARRLEVAHAQTPTLGQRDDGRSSSSTTA